MTTFQIYKRTITCLYPIEIEPGYSEKTYTITSFFNAHNVFQAIVDECIYNECPLSLSEELILWRTLKDICELYQLSLFRDDDIESIRYYISCGENYTAIQTKSVHDFLRNTEEVILSELKEETQSIVKVYGGRPAPYTEKNARLVIPHKSP
jgi:hypothetical protein